MFTMFDALACRCDHCNRRTGECERVYLGPESCLDHPNGPDVAICPDCCGRNVNGEWVAAHTPQYWDQWLNKLFNMPARNI